MNACEEGLATEAGKAGELANYHRHEDGHRYITVEGQCYRSDFLAVLYSFGRWPVEVEHLNGNIDDDRPANLKPTFENDA